MNSLSPSALTSGGMLIFFVDAARDDLGASSGNGRCSAFASSHGARIQTSRFSSVVRITGIALGWSGATMAFGAGSSVGDWFDDWVVGNQFEPYCLHHPVFPNHENSCRSKRGRFCGDLAACF